MSVSESQQLAALVDRLLGRFPTASADKIRTLVEEERSQLEGSRVRDYIAVLIEHTVRDRLRALGFDETHHTIPDSDAGQAGGNVRAGKVPIETTFNARITIRNGGLGGGTS
ncbi:hypothetical protein [Agromyces sp. H66]|uniref:three-helix bundle dimerization domain-containing protein n=1 Tax=Agromyces sp. H66 TaxID=2529859 RepID=UPI001B7D8AB7|nr:hypothetical protein [Agromyces sp. H66]